MARALRKSMTPEEKHLWYQYLHNYQPRFLRQKVIGPYIVDFYCSKAKLVIELDGSQHYSEDAIKYDENRSAYLAQWDLLVIRIPNNAVRENFDGVCDYIDQIVNSRI